MRRRRSFLSTEIYFVTIRTVEERFALDPYACPKAWLDSERSNLDLDTRQAMRKRGRACVDATNSLTTMIAQAEQDDTQERPEVPYKTFTDSIPNIIGRCMARGINMFGAQIYGFVWMSNHGHMLVRVPNDKFADFMEYLNGQIAANVNRFLGRKHQLWARRYAAAQVLDEAAELDMLAYLLANPQNAGVANSIDEWPGLSSAAYFFENREQQFLCFDRTAWHQKGRPNNIAPFLSTVKLKHELLPQLSRMHKATAKEKLRQLVRAIVKPSRIAEMQLGLCRTQSVRRQLLKRTAIPMDRPESSTSNPRKRSPQPLCHTTKPLLRKIYYEWYRAFCVAYEMSSQEYRVGNTETEFPPGSFAPSKYPRARHTSAPDVAAKLHPTRANLNLICSRMPLVA